MSDPYSLHNLDLLSILGHHYNPCTSDQPLSSYIRQESNGPFLRPLCFLWRQMASPHLKSLDSFNSTAHDPSNNHDQDEVTLATLSLQQEFTVASFLRHSYTSKDAFTTLQPFSMFASQLDLFCKIKTDLIAIKNDVPDGHRDGLYEEIWQSTIQEFVQQKEATCKNGKEQHDHCLGRLIWGEAYDWSSSALYFSFIGYLEKLKTQKDLLSTDPFPLVAPSSSSSDLASITNTFTPATSFGDSHGFPSPSNLDPTLQITQVDPSSLAIGGLVQSIRDPFTHTAASPFNQSRRPTWTDFWDTNMINHFLDSNIVPPPSHEELSDQQEILNDPQLTTVNLPSSLDLQTIPSGFVKSDQQSSSSSSYLSPNISDNDQQQFITSDSISPLSIAHRDHAGPSTIRPKLNRARSSSSSISTKSKATSERSRRHYMKAKAERSVLNSICAKLNELTYELQHSDHLHGTGVAQSMISARTASSSYQQIAISPIRTSSTENDPNKRKRESKLRKRNEDLQNAEKLIGYARMIVRIAFPLLLDRIAYLKSHEAKTAMGLISSLASNNPENIALDRVLQIWLDFEYGWKEILEGVQRLSKTETSTLDHPVETAIHLLRAASTL